MMTLRAVVERYNSLATQPNAPVALGKFALPTEETEKLFSALDEDYHISRFLHFSNVDGEKYLISGELVTHVAIEPAIHSLF